MRYFPTEQWLAEFGRLIDDSDTLEAVSAGWGVGFDGDVLLIIEDLPLSETTVGDLPESIQSEIPEAFRGGLADVTLAEAPSFVDGRVREGLPDALRDLLDQLEVNVVDGDVHAYVGLEEGSCTGVDIVDGPDARDVGFTIRGAYPAWRRIVDGRPATSALLSSDLRIEGSWVRLGQYAAVPQLLGEIAAEVETEHLFASTEGAPGDAILDEAVRTPVAVQRLAQRQAAWASRSIGLF